MPSTRSTPGAYAGAALDLDYRPFSLEDTKAVIGAARLEPVGLSESDATIAHVMARLNEKAQWYDAGLGSLSAPTERMTEKELERLAKQLDKLCETLGLEHDDCPLTGATGQNPRLPTRWVTTLAPHVPADRATPMTIPGDVASEKPETLLGAWSEAIHSLRDVVRAAWAGQGRGGEQPATRAEQAAADLWHGNPRQDLVRSLARLYSAIFSRPVGVSRAPDTQQLGGPLIRFVQAALDQLEVPTPAETIDDWLDDLRGKQFAAADVLLVDLSKEEPRLWVYGATSD